MADAPKKKRTVVQRPVFVVLQILGDDGEPLDIDKSRINVITATKDAGAALEVMDEGNHKYATYKKVMVA